MLEVLVLALSVMDEEAAPLGFTSTGLKPRLSSSAIQPHVQQSRWQMDRLKWSSPFVYLGSTIDSSGGSRGEILRRIGLARSCMQLLEKRIWKSSIRLNTKLRLYQTYVVPVLLYGCETWSTTKYTFAIALMRWAIRKILRIPYTRHMTNIEVRHISGCQPLSHHNRQKIAPLWPHHPQFTK